MTTVSHRECPALVAVRLIVAAWLILGFLPACGSAAATADLAGEGGTMAAPSEPVPSIVALARNHYCIVANDQVWCAGGLSSNGPFYDATPEQPAVPGEPISAIAVSIQHACSVHVDGDVSCWGANGAGETGTDSAPAGTCSVVVTDGGSGETPCQPHPTRVADIENVTALQLGDARSCALTAEGTVQCWGLPVRGPEWLAQQSGVASIAMGNQAACALFADGHWGVQRRAAPHPERLDRRHRSRDVSGHGARVRASQRRTGRLLGLERIGSAWHRQHRSNDPLA
jgi:hypothetical protein